MSPLLILLCATVLIFALLLKQGTNGRRDLKEIVATGLASINIAGVLGLGWFVVEMLTNDGVMIPEILGCVVLMALLAGFTAGGLALQRRGKSTGEIVLLAVGALPTIVTFGFMFYLTFNPIDWR